MKEPKGGYLRLVFIMTNLELLTKTAVGHSASTLQGIFFVTSAARCFTHWSISSAGFAVDSQG